MTRGRGAVGEMTHLITRAFAEVEAQAGRGGAAGKLRAATILIIDEADALAESRAADQMHHEDRAGVNAVIRGIDRLTDGRLPVVVLMCTNRDGALDPAIVRRASAHYTFGRPGLEQCAFLLRRAFGDVFTPAELSSLAALTAPRNGQAYGFTFSDITNRLIPAVLLEAFPGQAVTFAVAKSVCERIEPTRPFDDSHGGDRA
jgi:AAA+ superfamily predicted ATPase